MMFLARRAMRLGWPLATADTVAAVRAMRNRPPTSLLRAIGLTVSGDARNAAFQGQSRTTCGQRAPVYFSGGGGRMSFSGPPRSSP